MHVKSNTDFPGEGSSMIRWRGPGFIKAHLMFPVDRGWMENRVARSHSKQTQITWVEPWGIFQEPNAWLVDRRPILRSKYRIHAPLPAAIGSTTLDEPISQATIQGHWQMSNRFNFDNVLCPTESHSRLCARSIVLWWITTLVSTNTFTSRKPNMQAFQACRDSIHLLLPVGRLSCGIP